MGMDIDTYVGYGVNLTDLIYSGDLELPWEKEDADVDSFEDWLCKSIGGSYPSNWNDKKIVEEHKENKVKLEKEFGCQIVDFISSEDPDHWLMITESIQHTYWDKEDRSLSPIVTDRTHLLNWNIFIENALLTLGVNPAKIEETVRKAKYVFGSYYSC